MITVTIVSWNTQKLLRNCLNSLLNDKVKEIAEIHIVDNNSRDGSVEMVLREFPEAKLFVNKENLGFARANNQSWAAANGRYWLLLNSDTIVTPGAIEKLVAFLDANPKAGLVSAKLLNPDGTIQHCAQRVQGIFLTLLEFSRFHRLLPAKISGDLLLGPYFSYDRSRRIGWAWGTCLMARREAVEQAGALSNDFFMYGEDLEWSLRVRKHGWEIWFYNEAEIIHSGGQSSDQVWSGTEKHSIILNNCYQAIEAHRGRLYVKVLQLITLGVATVELGLSKVRQREAMSKHHRAQFDYHLRKLMSSVSWK